MAGKSLRWPLSRHRRQAPRDRERWDPCAGGFACAGNYLDMANHLETGESLDDFARSSEIFVTGFSHHSLAFKV